MSPLRAGEALHFALVAVVVLLVQCAMFWDMTHSATVQVVGSSRTAMTTLQLEYTEAAPTALAMTTTLVNYVEGSAEDP